MNASGTACKHLSVPASRPLTVDIGDKLLVSGVMLCGRDAVLPKVCQMIELGNHEEMGIDLRGAAVFHTAVSDAGIGPTSSNKVEIEESFAMLCDAGVKVFLGKGRLKPETVKLLGEHGAIYAVVPPVSALLGTRMSSKKCIAHPELGMEALYEVQMEECPAIVAAANGMSLFDEEEQRG